MSETLLFEENCPDSLIEELASRRCVIFLGSGASATAKDQDGKSPLTWEDFVKGIKSTMGRSKTETIEFIDNEIKKGNYLLALQAIYDETKKADYIRFLEKEFKHGYEPSALHKSIQRIDSKVVITTNFDKIYESLCTGAEYTTLNYDDTKSIVHELKSPRNLIIKAHGTIDKPDDIIFTSSQYYDSQEQYPEFYNLLSALFLTNTVVFIGYSLSDPDINLVLQFLHKTATESSPHYLIMKTGTSKHLKDHWRKVYNVEVIEYGEEYDDLLPAMAFLADSVESYRRGRGVV